MAEATYNGTTYVFNISNNNFHGGQFYLTELAKRIQGPQEDSDVVRTALLQLFEEKLVTEARQWWAIYCVLTQQAGYPEGKMDFCRCIDRMGLELAPPCICESWRKGQNIYPTLPKRVEEWSQKLGVSDEKTRQVITIAIRLLELIIEG